ncbi:thiamine pyrophosphate-binding protein [Runella aurantiaca]|uniref:Thiamine pyrophosphate-binding protein n=1 Tax=Runella aurantiaca TaxID=2282308 RepID=A0A369IDG1_9BACT|nr:thiamine pyrophosphate-binding protein [Runella aurantiaca]RDB07821.1 thiamine pyrophosphate-binding protein [Runella aurantiaca]
MLVSDYIANFLVKKNVQHVFGYTGGAILKLIHSFIDTGKISYIQNYHEQASAFCADAYGRLTGNIGVAIATSGPGATNLVTGIANAHLDSVPTLFITGQDYAANTLRQNGSRQNGFQDLDIVTIVKPITKYAATVYDKNLIREELEKAFYFACNGRPGAVLLDIPIDLQFQEIAPDELIGFSYPPPPSFDYKAIPDIIQSIQNAKRPIVLAGGGIQLGQAVEALEYFVTITNIPVVTTLNGIDAVSNSYSFSGLHGNTFSNLAVQNADLLIVLGARLGQRQVGKKPEAYTNAKVIHVDIDNSELNRVMSEDISVQSAIKPFLDQINIKIKDVQLPDFSAWHVQIQNWEDKYCATTHMSKEGLDPVRAVKLLSAIFNNDTVITNDVGQNQMWVTQAFRKKGKQRLLNSSGLGSMGYSLPASIAATFACPDSQIIAFTGDGGLQMNLQELMLVGQRQLPIKCIVFNNNSLGMMREVQKRYYNEIYYGSSTEDFVCVDLEKLAATYNLGYFRIENEEQIPLLKTILEDKKPHLIDLRIAFDSLLSNRYDESEIFSAEKIV